MIPATTPSRTQSRVAVVASGTLGDVLPAVCIANDLSKRGTHIRFITNPDFRWLAQDHWEVEELPIRADTVLSSDVGCRLTEGGFFGIARAMAGWSLVRRNFSVMARAVMELLPGSSIVIYNGATCGIATIAANLGIPAHRLYLRPAWPNKHVPNHFISTAKNYGSIGNFGSHVLAEVAGQMTAGSSLRHLSAIQRSHRSRGWRNQIVVDPARFAQSTSFFAIPPQFAPPHLHRRRNALVAGFIDTKGMLTIHDSDMRQVMDRLQNMTSDGVRLAYVGFGSWGLGSRTAPALASALDEVGVTAVCSERDAWTLRQQSFNSIVVAPPVDHSRLFTKCDIVVHHGGAGTVATSLRAGVPMVIIPRIFDQYYWADRCSKLGLAASVPDRHPSRRSVEIALRWAMKSADNGLVSERCRLIDLRDGAPVIADAVSKDLHLCGAG
jgi:sterol 3beta-glucosyltransferase